MSRDDGIVELLADIPPEGAPPGMHGTVRAAARGDVAVEARHPVAEGSRGP